MNWVIGVTTVPARFQGGQLASTLASLRAGGFTDLRLFVDGATVSGPYETAFDLPATVRYPAVKAYPNWFLSLSEMYFRNSLADRFIIFQDDVICSKNLRQYLETIPYPLDGYWNLYSEPVNEMHVPLDYTGFYPAAAKGKGALGLCFDRTNVCLLLSSRYMIDRIQNRTPTPNDGYRGESAIDGGVWAAMREVGRREYCHSPGLLQHARGPSTIGNKDRQRSKTFKGEGFDCLEW